MKYFLRALIFLFVAAGFFFVETGFAEESSWWNNQWGYRKKVAFDTTKTGSDIAENLVGAPVLLRLHSGNFDFTKALDDGSDIRFIKGDDETDLKHHIEYYDSIDEIGLVWVNVPMILAGSDQDYIRMYYGNKNAMGGQDAAGTYDVNQVAVYHFSEMENLPEDSTAYKNNAGSFMGTQGLPSVVGNGVSLNGAGDRIMIPSSPSLSFKDGITFSLWVKLLMPQDDSCLFAMNSEGRTLEVRVDESKIYVLLKEGDNIINSLEKTADVSTDKWRHFAFTAATKQRITIFLDSLKITWTDIDSFSFENVTDISIGSDVKGEACFSGDIDEINISNLVRSDAWIRALYASQAPDSLMCGFVEEEIYEGGGLPTFYFATIAKNISLDGLIIIGILIIFAVMSWIVMIGKSFNLWYIEKDDRAFMGSFRDSRPVPREEDEDTDYPSSVLYRIYAAGWREFNTMAHGDSIEEISGDAEKAGVKISKKALEKVKNALERSYAEEARALNSWMVLLTMAITGGPFLGLLGTVWGVMNTFASLAEAGEASITAIAPGVSSALATTVFGLIVAIPALFGYNYLAVKVRKATGEMDLFMDELTTMFEQYEEQEK
ncbi:MAG: DUF2341 domain-containing protein [Deltaproteobacteria bacterium]|nr:DUF2341 domain-containing protein [Deltaproteobacteria bacterium]